MANKAISELPQAQNVNNQDLFVLEQSGIAKKLTAETFITEQGIIDALAEALDGHGGITSVTLSSVSGRIRTYLITFTDETTTTFQVLDGTSIDRIVKTSTAGLTDTYTVFMNDGTTTFFTVTNGADGEVSSSSIATTFDPATSYTKGNYVWYGGQLYVFTSDRDVGAWNQSDVESVAIGNELSNLKSALTVLNVAFDAGLDIKNGTVKENGYLLYTNGNTQESHDYQVTDFIQVKSGDRIYYKGVISGSGSNLGVGLYTKPTSSTDFVAPLVVLSGGSGRVYTQQVVTVPGTYGDVLFIRASSAYDNTANPSYPKAPVSVSVFSPVYKPESTEIYQGDYEQGGYSATEPTVSTQRIHMKDCVALPYGDKTVITVSCNPSYLFAVRAGRTAQNLSSNLYWFISGQQVRFSNKEQYYRIVWAKGVISTGVYEDISPSDIDDINPSITYSFDDSAEKEDIAEMYAEPLECFVNSQNVLSASSHGGIGTMPVIFHASDVHGDLQRVKNAMFLSERYSADALVISGDIVSNKPSDGAEWMHSLFNDFSGKPIICTGNHEVNQNGITDEQVYTYYMQPSASKIGNTSGKTYYYTDIASKKLRIISVDLYQYGATTRSNAHMSSEQLAYICNALKSTPSGYGILMVAHTPCVNVGNLKDANYSTFFQSLRKYGFAHYDITGTPIYDIVDAFINRTTISKTYAQTGSPSSISVSDDFSGVDSSVEFIAHLTGHIHEDSVCYLPTTAKQLMLNICCGVAMTGGSEYPYLADDCDITRLPYGKTQDAINAYVIDRTNKRVNITRIGGTLTYDMKERKYMSIPYAD